MGYHHALSVAPIGKLELGHWTDLDQSIWYKLADSHVIGSHIECLGMGVIELPSWQN